MNSVQKIIAFHKDNYEHFTDVLKFLPLEKISLLTLKLRREL